MEEAVKIAIALAALGFSVIFHEMAHAWSALKLGDPTAAGQNRLSWNPIHHIDPLFTIVMPIVTFLSLGFPFGGAKPVSINPLNFRNPGRDWMISSALGPLSNVLLSALTFGALLALWTAAPNVVLSSEKKITVLGYLLFIMIFTNVGLATFNLIPIPPLDGSRVLRYVLPREAKGFLDSLEPFGMLLIILLAWQGAFGWVFGPVLNLLQDLLVSTFGVELWNVVVRTMFRGHS